MNEEKLNCLPDKNIFWFNSLYKSHVFEELGIIFQFHFLFFHKSKWHNDLDIKIFI